MDFTQLDLKAPVNTILDNGKRDLDNARRQHPLPAARPGQQRDPNFQQQLRQAQQAQDQALTPVRNRVYQAVLTEIDRQMKIYTDEETDYVNDTKAKHQRAKQLSKELVDTARSLATGWDDAVAGPMAGKVRELEAIKKEVHENADGVNAHAGFRGASAWDDAKAKDVLGQQQATQLSQHYVQQRAPMITLTADLKTYIVKIDEFVVRGHDSLKVAAELASRQPIKQKEAIDELKALQTNIQRQAGDLDSLRSTNLKIMQEFVVKYNSNRNALDADAMKMPQILSQSVPLKIKNQKTYLKTLIVQMNNAKLRMKPLLAKSKELPPLVEAIERKLGEMTAELKTIGDNFDSFDRLFKQRKQELGLQ